MRTLQVLPPHPEVQTHAAELFELATQTPVLLHGTPPAIGHTIEQSDPTNPGAHSQAPVSSQTPFPEQEFKQWVPHADPEYPD